MARKPYPANVQEQAHALQDALKEIDPNLKIGSFDLGHLTTNTSQARAALVQAQALDIQRDEAHQSLHTANAELWDVIKRIRNGIKGIYGDDSYEFEKVGGTRVSGRKAPTRKTRQAAAQV